jgi:predicted glycogen debranching enzyme
VTLPLLSIDRELLLQLERSMSREWLQADGLGGYASSTAILCPARRYHGLLVTPAPGTVKRHVFLARFEEWFHGGGKSVSISIGRYPGTWGPLGHQGIERFELAPLPRWTYRFGHATLEREILLLRGEPTVLVRYRVTGQQNPVEMRLRPLLPYREADKLTFENYELDRRVERIPRGIVVKPYASLPPLHVTLSSPAHFEVDPLWYKNIEYPADIARGYEGIEDNFTPGVFHVALAEGQDVVVAAALRGPVDDPLALWQRERGARVSAASEVGRDVRSRLAYTADDFLFRTERGRLAVDAGYPWFGEWGRDSCISLPGLCSRAGACRSAPRRSRACSDTSRKASCPTSSARARRTATTARSTPACGSRAPFGWSSRHRASRTPWRGASWAGCARSRATTRAAPVWA